MEVSNPRRILAVSLEGSAHHLGRVIKDLTGTHPEQTSTSLAGTTHILSLRTPYYTADVPIWLDLVTSPSEWAATFLSDEAGEVLAVLGGVVLVFALSSADSATTRDLVRHFGSVVEKGLGGWGWDGVGLAVGVGEGGGDEVEEWDELCAEVGLEFVQLTGKEHGRNEFSEKTGIERVKEALEANDWAQADSAVLSDDFGEFEEASSSDKAEDAELDPERLDFGYDKADFEGMRKAIWGAGHEEGDGAAGAKMSGPPLQNLQIPSRNDTVGSQDDAEGKDSGRPEGNADEEDVAKVETMMRKLQAVREAGEGLSLEQRRRMAAQAVEEVMKEL